MDVHVAIIGAGFSGIGAAIRLQQHGITDVVLLERAADLGGTWRDNTYPGCACDIPSRLYSFSFAQNPSWSRRFSGQAEIHAYLRNVADRYDVTPRIRFRHALRHAQWDEGTQRWHLATTGEAVTARILVLATGALSDPAIPDLPGLSQFEGPRFHSAQWQHDVDLTGKRVAVLGTGASAIQFVPAIQPDVAQLTLFQRTPPWIIPRWDREIGAVEQAALRVVPGLMSMVRGGVYAMREATYLPFRHRALRRVVARVARWHLTRQVADPTLRRALTPNYEIGCKRVLVSDDYYPAITRDNVRLVTTGIRAITPRGVETTDGVHHGADVLILGTGFRPTDPPLAPYIVGRSGQTAADAWRESFTAYAATTLHGFPNLFVIPGPNAGLGHNSMIYMIESQLSHLIGALTHMQRGGHGALEPTLAAQQQWTRDIDQTMRDLVWVRGGCSSWYLDRTGRNSTLWPDFTFRFRRRVAPFQAAHYHSTPQRTALPRGAALQ